MALTDAERAAYTTYLAQARAARHTLMTGGGLVSVGYYNGNSASFRPADLRLLESYINELERLLGLPETVFRSGRTKSRPVYF